jgi:hypothetical protein
MGLLPFKFTVLSQIEIVVPATGVIGEPLLMDIKYH